MLEPDDQKAVNAAPRKPWVDPQLFLIGSSETIEVKSIATVNEHTGIVTTDNNRPAFDTPMHNFGFYLDSGGHTKVSDAVS